MLLELAVGPDDAARLLRLPLLAPLKTGRTRSRAIRIVWHDGAENMLAEQGLALTEQRGTWRLERLHPEAEEAWAPGAPAPVLGEDRSRTALLEQPPAPLLAVATFEGRSSTLALACDGSPVSLTVLQGSIRSLANERSACRITLDGPDDAVQALALRLTEQLPLALPRASLAAEAMAAMRGAKLPPRREGAPVLPSGLSVTDAYTHVLGHLTDVIVFFAPAAATGEDGPEPVHQMRVAVRRLRSANKVFRRALRCAAIDAADSGLKALAARLGPTRDWDVFVTETGASVTAAFPNDARIQRLLTAAERRRRACHAELRKFLESAEFRRLGIELACLAGGRAWHAALSETEQVEQATPLDDFAARVLNQRLKRLLQPGDDIAGLEPTALHAIRLHAKRLRYAAEIFAPLYPGKSTSRFLRRLSVLQQRLGELNDGVVATALLAELSGKGGNLAFAAGMVVGFLGARGARVHDKAGRAWERLRKLAPFWA